MPSRILFSWITSEIRYFIDYHQNGSSCACMTAEHHNKNFMLCDVHQRHSISLHWIATLVKRSTLYNSSRLSFSTAFHWKLVVKDQGNCHWIELNLASFIRWYDIKLANVNKVLDRIHFFTWKGYTTTIISKLLLSR